MSILYINVSHTSKQNLVHPSCFAYIAEFHKIPSSLQDPKLHHLVWFSEKFVNEHLSIIYHKADELSVHKIYLRTTSTDLYWELSNPFWQMVTTLYPVSLFKRSYLYQLFFQGIKWATVPVSVVGLLVTVVGLLVTGMFKKFNWAILPSFCLSASLYFKSCLYFFFCLNSNLWDKFLGMTTSLTK